MKEIYKNCIWLIINYDDIFFVIEYFIYLFRIKLNVEYLFFYYSLIYYYEMFIIVDWYYVYFNIKFILKFYESLCMLIGLNLS